MISDTAVPAAGLVAIMPVIVVCAADMLGATTGARTGVKFAN